MFAFGNKEWPGLAKLNEEAGELVQVIGKLMMTHGKSEHWEPGVNLRVKLIEEMADVAAALAFQAAHVLSMDEVQTYTTRSYAKLALFDKWHVEQAEPARVQSEVERRVREETERFRKQHEDTHRVLCERNTEIAELKRSNEALVRALGQKGP